MYKKHIKKIMSLVTMFVIFVSSFAINQNILSAKDEVYNNKIVLSEKVGDLANNTDLEKVLTNTENNFSKRRKYSYMMTSEKMEINNLELIGQTENGSKIYSTATKEVVEAFLANPKTVFNSYAVGNSSGMLTWMGQYSTPMIWLDGMGYVYCSEPYEAFPADSWYDAGTWLLDAGLDAIMFWGFPHNFGGQHGLSDEEAYLRTFVAINAYIGTFNRATVQSYADPYVDFLLSKADLQDVPTETYTVHSPNNLESHYNQTKKWSETDFYEITGAIDSRYWLENLPATFFMIDENGNEVNELIIPSKFKLGTRDLSFSGEVNFDVKTTIAPSASIKFSSPGVQTLFGLGRHDPLPGYSETAKFKAATANIEEEKVVIGYDGKPLSPKPNLENQIEVQYWKKVGFVPVFQRMLKNSEPAENRKILDDGTVIEYITTKITDKLNKVYLNDLMIYDDNGEEINYYRTETVASDYLSKELGFVKIGSLKEYAGGTFKGIINNSINELKIGTKAMTPEGGQLVPANTVVEVVDVIEPKEGKCGYIPGMIYKAVGYAMNKTTGELLVTVDGEVKVEKTFIPESVCHEEQMHFTINTTGLEGIEIVFFEEIYYGNSTEPDDLIADHKDINDEGQTIRVQTELASTGFLTNKPALIAAMILTISLILLFSTQLVRNLKKQNLKKIR